VAPPGEQRNGLGVEDTTRGTNTDTASLVGEPLTGGGCASGRRH